MNTARSHIRTYAVRSGTYGRLATSLRGWVHAGLLVVLCCVVGGCLSSTPMPGTVATVNGQPITLRMVESRYDADGRLSVVAQNPSVELLQQQYGAILAELIVQELIVQELERLELGISESDLEQTVAVVRQDYGEKAFGELLRTENIDEKTWRELLRYTMSMRRFAEQVLRPQLVLSPEEVEKYYREHLAEFFVPAQDELLVLSSMDKADLQQARTRALEGAAVRDLEVLTQHQLLRPALMPEAWAQDIARLSPGQATAVRPVDNLFQCVVLRSRRPARRMAAVEAYPQIEQALVESKMSTLFAEWLDAATATADIQVSPLLKARPVQARPEPKVLDGGTPSAPNARDTENAGGAENAQDAAHAGDAENTGDVNGQ